MNNRSRGGSINRATDSAHAICIRGNVSRQQRHPAATFDCHENATSMTSSSQCTTGREGGREEVPSAERAEGLCTTTRDTKIGINEIDTTLSYST